MFNTTFGYLGINYYFGHQNIKIITAKINFIIKLKRGYDDRRINKFRT